MALLRHRDVCSIDTSMERRRDEPWRVTNGCICSACEYVKQFLLIRWFDREYVDERDETCVLRNRSHRKSPASDRELAPDPRTLCVSGRRHARSDPRADTGHGLHPLVRRAERDLRLGGAPRAQPPARAAGRARHRFSAQGTMPMAMPPSPTTLVVISKVGML